MKRKERMEKLNCRRLTIPEGNESSELIFNDKEVVYFIAGGYGHLEIIQPDVNWQYPLQGETTVYVPENSRHILKNKGIGNLECVVFESSIS